MIHKKRKIINDPVHGFITIPDELIFDLIEHPYFQRLRYIKQLGLTYLVYPGAIHTRFQHALGAMHLITQAAELLKSKGHNISHEEEQALAVAILLHDIGHGPFSHALENSIVDNVSHEEIGKVIMSKLNKIFSGNLDKALQIFCNTYEKKFLHQLVSGQLDVDRLDYLTRDSFFTGVSEGVISTDRIIKMLNVFEDELVVESKGIYSVEKFIVARRLMYWQVYLHKTVLSAEHLLTNILKRAKVLIQAGEKIFVTPQLNIFLSKSITIKDFNESDAMLENFSRIDDTDIFMCVKMWQHADDAVLAMLCQKLVNRELLKIEISDTSFNKNYVEELQQKTANKLNISSDDASYFVFTGEVANNAYNPNFDKILLLYNPDHVADITKSSEQINVELLSKVIRKHFVCYPRL